MLLICNFLKVRSQHITPDNKRMKKYLLITLATITFTIPSHTFGQLPEWLWAKSAKGANIDRARTVSTDDKGNVYVVGWFDSDSITFASTTLIKTSGFGYDIFIAKYNPNGDVLWAKSAEGIMNDLAVSVSTDDKGNVYVTGYFWSSITFGSTTLINAGTNSYDIFLVKYDSSGNVLWAKSAGGAGDDKTNSVSTDAGGNVYVAGSFGSSFITFGSTTLINADPAGHLDIFITKYDGNGNVLWAKSAGGIINDEPQCISTDVRGNVYITGSFQNSSITFGSIVLTNSGIFGDIFITKYDSNGNVLWAKSEGGLDDDEARSVSNSGGNLYITGWFKSPYITFGSTTLINANSGVPDMFITKYNSEGDVLWAKGTGGGNFDYANSVATDDAGNVYQTGYFYSSSVTFGSTTLANAGGSDIFITKYDGNGNIIWVKSPSGASDDQTHSVSTFVGGDVYVAGYFASSEITFDSITLTNAGSYDMLVAKLEDRGCSALQVEVSSVGDLDICSTGSVDLIAISWGTVSYQWLKNGFPIPGATDKKYHATETGDYYVRIKDEDGCKDISNKITVYTSCKLDPQPEADLISGLRVYPNPASERFTIVMTLPENLNAIAWVQLINTLGLRLRDEPVPIVNGVVQKEIELQNVAPGIYMVSVTVGNKVYNSQVNLQK